MRKPKKYGALHLSIGIPLIVVLAVVFVLVLVNRSRVRRRLLSRRSWSVHVVEHKVDTTLGRWRKRMHHRVDRLEHRYRPYRNRDVGYTVRQAELAQAADSGFRAVRSALDDWPEEESYARRIRRARRVKRMFKDLKKPVYKFGRDVFLADSTARAKSGDLD